jgi:alanine-glyoxylate transaminase / serine-glyoxylate transaminase / serine-pyruvate transaminase
MSDLPDAGVNPPARHLLGPGPSPVHPAVARALAAPVLGHLDPAYLRIMDETQALLRAAFRTENRVTLALPGTGSSGMEAAMVNLLEQGDTAIIGVAGYFGERMVDVASRQGAIVVRVDAGWGEALKPEQLAEALAAHPGARMVAIVQGETSTGVLQPVREIARLAREAGALMVVDAVTSFGGVELPIDEWGIDLCYSCSQKCLGCPPGLSPITVSERAMERIAARSRPVPNFYLDLTLLAKYWGPERVYHHTASAPLTYALRAGLALLHEEGLHDRVARHARNAAGLRAGLAALGIAPLVPEGWLPMITTARVPDGVDEARVRTRLLTEHGIEIGSGLGPLRGKVWRIGLMGHGSSPAYVLLLLHALEQVLTGEGLSFEPGSSLAAASRAISTSD